MKNEEMYILIEGYDSIEKNVRAYGHSGGLIVPKIWKYGRVKVISLTNNYGKGPIQSKGKKRTIIPSEKKLYKLYGYDTVTKNVIRMGNGAGIKLQQKWIGKHVKVILIKKPEEKEEQ